MSLLQSRPLDQERSLLPRTIVATRALALLAFAFFLFNAFWAGWTRAETDFPNYYTAALLVRKGLPLHNYYDWTWFLRQMNYAGIERQLGAYTPQTPLTMLPMMGFTTLGPQTAKQIWLVLNLGFLAATVFLLSRVTRFRFEQVALLAFLGYYSLYLNFLYGQYYVFLLFLLTLTYFFLHRGNGWASSTVAGIAFGLKLYGGPFLLYFAAKRNWKAVAGMTVAILPGCHSHCDLRVERYRLLRDANPSTNTRGRLNRPVQPRCAHLLDNAATPVCGRAGAESAAALEMRPGCFSSCGRS